LLLGRSPARAWAALKWAPVAALCLSGLGCATDTVFHGRYYFGHEARSFLPCGSGKAYWVSADEDISRVLRDRAEQLRERLGKPYQPLFIEAVGEIDVRTRREGFARDYDGLFRLRKLLRVSETVPLECAR
jgi:hypothetical protein